MPPKDTKVIIIGSGFSGLTAAKALKNAGWSNVRILEARDRIGGRTHTQDIGGTGGLVDVGAAWIHGDVDNPLAGLANKVGAEYVSHSEMKQPPAAIVDLSDDGSERAVWSEEETIAGMGKLAEVVPTIKPGDSAFGAFTASLEGLEGTERVRAMFAMHAPIAGACGPTDDLNIHPLVSGKVGRLAEGYDQLPAGGFSNIVKLHAAGLNIALNKVITKIELVNDEKEVTLTCEDGTVETVDYVICTVPLGVLKKEKIAFNPTLPKAKTDAIAALDMGSFEKVIMIYDEMWWEDGLPKNHIFLVNKIKDDGSRPFPTFVDITGKLGMPAIVCLYEGKFARHAQDTMTDEEMVATCRETFALALGKDPSKVPQCKGSECTRWRTDPYSYGSYSYFTLASKPEDMDAIAEPAYGGRLMFAGEHTIKEHNASVHGPIISGLREALRLDKDAAVAGVKPGPIPPPE